MKSLIVWATALPSIVKTMLGIVVLALTAFSARDKSTAKSPPATNPMTLPSSACSVLRPVPSALERSTVSVPSTTQNA